MRNILLILGVIAALAVGGLAIYEWQGAPVSDTAAPTAMATADTAAGGTAKGAGAVTASDIVLGKADAPVTVIEYASLTCPHCARFQNETMPQIKKNLIETGKLRWVMRDFPLDKAALAAAMVARCAGPDRRYGMIELFFARQAAWAGAEDPIKALAQTAKFAGMDQADVKACLKKDKVQRAVVDQRLKGEQIFKVDSTPTFIINGTKRSGEMSYDEFKAIVEPLLKKAD